MSRTKILTSCVVVRASRLHIVVRASRLHIVVRASRLHIVVRASRLHIVVQASRLQLWCRRPACNCGAGVPPAHCGAGVPPAHCGAGVPPAIVVRASRLQLWCRLCKWRPRRFRFARGMTRQGRRAHLVAGNVPARGGVALPRDRGGGGGGGRSRTQTSYWKPRSSGSSTPPRCYPSHLLTSFVGFGAALLKLTNECNCVGCALFQRRWKRENIIE